MIFRPSPAVVRKAAASNVGLSSSTIITPSLRVRRWRAALHREPCPVEIRLALELARPAPCRRSEPQAPAPYAALSKQRRRNSTRLHNLDGLIPLSCVPEPVDSSLL